MKDEYVTESNQTFYILVICLVFFFTSIVFIGYDCWVERRQKLVMESTIQSDATVSSLFPQSVKQQLYQKGGETADEPILPSRKSSWYDGPRRQSSQQPWRFRQQRQPPKGPSIAESYKETTITFAGKYPPQSQ